MKICWKNNTSLQSSGIHDSSTFYSTLLSVFVFDIFGFSWTSLFVRYFDSISRFGQFAQHQVYEVQRTEFLTIFDYFLLFYPINNAKNLEKIFEKLKKMPRDIIILHICTINANHVWFLRYKTEFFVILDYFLPFYFLTTPKIKILKNLNKQTKKTLLDILSFYACKP